jgi:Cof subfamily protein (haloacid dehalogenase superfamily)
MKYLCVFDLDNTLLSPDQTISKENMDAIQKLRELDVGVSLATGRSPLMIGKYIEMLSLTLPIIACNGAVLILPDSADARLKPQSARASGGNEGGNDGGNEGENYKILQENPIQPQIAASLLLYMLEQRADFLAYTGHMVYHSKGSCRVENFRKYNQSVPAHLQAPLEEFTRSDLDNPLPDFIKILLNNPTPEQESYVREIPELEAVASANNSIDIMHTGSTKGNGIVSLGKHLGIPVENIAVFGDNENDVSMFTSGALGIAMGNSREEFKQKARYVTGTNAESGVARGIYKYVLPYFGVGS